MEISNDNCKKQETRWLCGAFLQTLLNQPPRQNTDQNCSLKASSLVETSGSKVQLPSFTSPTSSKYLTIEHRYCDASDDNEVVSAYSVAKRLMERNLSRLMAKRIEERLRSWILMLRRFLIAKVSVMMLDDDSKQEYSSKVRSKASSMRTMQGPTVSDSSSTESEGEDDDINIYDDDEEDDGEYCREALVLRALHTVAFAIQIVDLQVHFALKSTRSSVDDNMYVQNDYYPLEMQINSKLDLSGKMEEMLFKVDGSFIAKQNGSKLESVKLDINMSDLMVQMENKAKGIVRKAAEKSIMGSVASSRACTPDQEEDTVAADDLPLPKIEMSSSFPPPPPVDLPLVSPTFSTPKAFASIPQNDACLIPLCEPPCTPKRQVSGGEVETAYTSSNSNSKAGEFHCISPLVNDKPCHGLGRSTLKKRRKLETSGPFILNETGDQTSQHT